MTASSARLAKDRPADLEEMSRNRRLSGKVIRRHGEALVSRIAAALERPRDTWPQPIRRGSAAHVRRAVLQATALAAGRRASWAPRLVTPDLRLEQLALLEAPTPQEIDSVLGSWRAELAAPALGAILGRRAGLWCGREGEIDFHGPRDTTAVTPRAPRAPRRGASLWTSPCRADPASAASYRPPAALRVLADMAAMDPQHHLRLATTSARGVLHARTLV